MSSFFYLAERLNPDMIYCGAAPPECTANQTDIDTSRCTIDSWGFVDCTDAGCPPRQTEDGTIQEPCWSLYRSIISSSFWTLMELFGEFPLMDQHSAWGQVLGTITTVFAAAVFALPAGIFGSGFEKEISKRQEAKRNEASETEMPSGLRGGIHKMDSTGDSSTFRGALYNFMYCRTTYFSRVFEICMDGIIIATTIVFMLDTVTNNKALDGWHGFFDTFQTVAFLIFTTEYILLMYCVVESPQFTGASGMIAYAQDFLRLVDLMSILPFCIMLLLWPILPSDHTALYKFAKFSLTLRLFRFEKYSQAFTTFDDVIRDNFDVLTVTGFSAALLWVLFSSVLYLSERDNPDHEMAARYKTVPHSMWITLLNLSGECPLAHYSSIGKVVVGIIGLFATAIFGVPVSFITFSFAI